MHLAMVTAVPPLHLFFLPHHVSFFPFNYSFIHLSLDWWYHLTNGLADLRVLVLGDDGKEKRFWVTLLWWLIMGIAV